MVTLPSSLIRIGDYAFDENLLTGIRIPDSVITIGNYAFRNNRLNNVTIGCSVTSINSYAFSQNRLTSVTIPDSVISIGNNAFGINDNLKSINIGANVSVGGHDGSFYPMYNFSESYTRNNSRAGTYNYDSGRGGWNYIPRR